jgi:ParB family chromosome partitioning protein
MNAPPAEPMLELIPIDRIDVLNTRDRNEEVFGSIVENIRLVGLKKPVTVTPRRSADGELRFALVCGEGRLRAFRQLGEPSIPALIVQVSDEDAFIMSLAENIARRKYRPLELIEGLKQLMLKGYTCAQIAEKTGLAPGYVGDLVVLVRKGEERLLSAVKSGTLPLRAALNIVAAGDDDKGIQGVLQDAYQSGDLRGRQLMDARRLIQKRQDLGPSFVRGGLGRKTPKISASTLVRAYQNEVLRQEAMVRNASFAQQRLVFLIGALRKLAADENFCNLLKAEGLESLPKYLADRILKQS